VRALRADIRRRAALIISPCVHLARSKNSQSGQGKVTVDRFTKLKGVLVNNLLKEYHKQTRQQGDQIVYNHAVMEVGKILAHNTRLTEQQLQELQRNFAVGVKISAPDRNIHVQTKKMSYSAKAAKSLAMSRTHASDLNETAHATVPSFEPLGVSQGMQTERGETAGHSPIDTTADSLHPAVSPGGGHSKRQRRVDEWSLLVLHNDVEHLETQKKLKEKDLVQKHKTGDELRRQMLQKEEEKRKKKLETVEIAQVQQAEYQKWKAEQERNAQIKQAKILAEKEHEAKELARVQRTKQLQAEKDFKEQQVQLCVINCVCSCKRFLLLIARIWWENHKCPFCCRRCWQSLLGR
jgi:hypothetical protein